VTDESQTPDSKLFHYLRIAGGVLGPSALLLFLLPIWSAEMDFTIRAMAGIAVWMSLWWIFEVIPLGATALLPLILYPILGISQTSAVTSAYMNDIIFLFLGGFLIALAMERWELHKRISLRIILFFGSEPSRLIIGFMVAAAFLSMWISNTATAVMLLPVGLSVLKRYEAMKPDRQPQQRDPFPAYLMLAIAYACSVGGMGTLIGTPPNLALAQIYNAELQAPDPLSFGRWLTIGLPVSLTMLVIIGAILTYQLRRRYREADIGNTENLLDGAEIQNEYEQLGVMSREEKIIAFVFGATAVLWIFRTNIELGGVVIPGWSNLLGLQDQITDATIALAMSVVLFLIPGYTSDPNKDQKKTKTRLLTKAVFKEVPWGIILLFGGGFALAEGFSSSGLSEFIGTQIQSWHMLPEYGLQAGTAGLMTFLTELTSNTASAQLMLPILISVAKGLQITPLHLMVPATLSASCAFMMPVATPPNAIMFGSGRIPIRLMVSLGFFLNLIGILVVTAWTLLML
jgi:sodium-dependent dicarboxylate transporter 2/3/5